MTDLSFLFQIFIGIINEKKSHIGHIANGRQNRKRKDSRFGDLDNAYIPFDLQHDTNNQSFNNFSRPLPLQ